MLGIAIGVAAVILLTSIGEGTRVYVLSQFTQFGTNIMAVNPGRSRTLGFPASSAARSASSRSTTPRRSRGSRHRDHGAGDDGAARRVEAGERGRSVTVLWATADLPALWKFGAARARSGRRATHAAAGASAVLGPKLARELFGARARSARWCASPAGASGCTGR
jgi:putative ABC transport system permease protein